MSKYLGRYRISPARLKNWDYGSSGWYFITICTHQGAHFFGKILPIQPRYLAAPPHFNPPVQPRYLAAPPGVLHAPRKKGGNPNFPHGTMPRKKDNNAPEPRGIAALRETEMGRIAREYWFRIPEFHPYVILDEFVVMPNHIHAILIINKPHYREWKPNQFGPQSQNLASILRGYKSGVTTYARKNNIDFKWHPKFHDKIIRTPKALRNIRNYIRQNPQKWGKDKFFSSPP